MGLRSRRTLGFGYSLSISVVVVVGEGRTKLPRASLAWWPRGRRHISSSNFFPVTTRVARWIVFPAQHQHGVRQEGGVYTCFSFENRKAGREQPASSRLLPEQGRPNFQRISFLVIGFFFSTGAEISQSVRRWTDGLSDFFNAGSANKRTGVRGPFKTYLQLYYYHLLLPNLVLPPQTLFSLFSLQFNKIHLCLFPPHETHCFYGSF